MPDPAKTADRIKAVDADDVQRIARAIFRPRRINLAYVGPAHDEQRLARCLEMKEL